MQQHLYQPTSLVPKGTAPMPPYAAANNMTTTELAKVGPEDELSKTREKELLAIIAARDKKIQQLEEKLETQNAFIESVLKLSDHYRQVSRQSKRRVSWCASVDEADVIQVPQNLKTYASEIRVDDLSDSEDDLSSLDDWKPPEPSPDGELNESEKKPSDRGPLSIFKIKPKAKPKPEPEDASEVSVEVDCDEMFEQMMRKKKAASSSLKKTPSKEGISSMKRTTSKDEFQPSVKRVASKEEKSVVQAIIEGMRNDDESIEF